MGKTYTPMDATAKTVDEIVDVVDHKDGATVDLVVVGLLEVFFDNAMNNGLKRVALYRSPPNYGVAVASRKVDIPIVICVVICPH